MENTNDAEIIAIESSELLSNTIELTQSTQSEFRVAFLCGKKILLEKIQVSCATPLARRTIFQHKRSMCHHRRKAYRGLCKRLPILSESTRFPRDLQIENMLNRSNRRAITKFTIDDITVTKMWHV